MATYQMQCSCGDDMKVEAGSRDEAVKTLQGMMSQGAIDAHMKEKHPGQPSMTTAQVHGMIAQHLSPA